jgi:transposase
VARRRAQWKKYQGRVDPRRLVFIDETWAKTNMTRLHGRCRRGNRLVAKVPHGRWHTLTFLAALRWDRIEAPCVIDGPINGRSFLAYVEQMLVPTLLPGDVVIMDNLGSHRRQAIRRAIRAAGAKLLFLPAYSPDLNPIEQVFAKLKTFLRKLDARTVETTWRGIGQLLDAFTPAECANYFRNSGYASAGRNHALGPIDIQDSRGAVCVIHRPPACCWLEAKDGEALRVDRRAMAADF